jgi:Arc/MetJ family transcription regulator
MVYHLNMARTNIDLDDELVAIIMRRYGVHTKREAVDLALRHLAGTPMTIAEALDMRGAHAISAIPPDQRP